MIRETNINPSIPNIRNVGSGAIPCLYIIYMDQNVKNTIVYTNLNIIEK